jgi:hypothetical protein
LGRLEDIWGCGAKRQGGVGSAHDAHCATGNDIYFIQFLLSPHHVAKLEGSANCDFSGFYLGVNLVYASYVHV